MNTWWWASPSYFYGHSVIPQLLTLLFLFSLLFLSVLYMLFSTGCFAAWITEVMFGCSLLFCIGTQVCDRLCVGVFLYDVCSTEHDTLLTLWSLLVRRLNCWLSAVDSQRINSTFKRTQTFLVCICILLTFWHFLIDYFMPVIYRSIYAYLGLPQQILVSVPYVMLIG